MRTFSLRYSYTQCVAVLAALFSPAIVFAAGLVPCGIPVQGATGMNYSLQATSCNLCSFGTLIQNLINYLLILAVPISIALFAWAGILYFTSVQNPKQIGTAKRLFKSVFIGFALALASWLIIQTILTGLLDPTFLGGRWNVLSCSDSSNANRPRQNTIDQIFSVVPAGVPGSIQVGVNPLWVAGPVNDVVQQICQLESGCGRNVDNGNGTGCNAYGACGPMQILPATACGTNPGFSAGCSPTGAVINQAQVAADLQNIPNSQALASQILTSVQTSPRCNGSMECAIAFYAQGAAALNPSACCVGGPAYQCPFDCGTTAARSYQCDVNPVQACVPARGAAYSYIQQVRGRLGR